jgi:hypothetical protein
MGKWKLFFVVLLINLAWTHGASCIVEKDGKILTLRNCVSDNLKSDQVTINPGEVIKINANGTNNDFPKLNDGIFKKYTNLETLYLGKCGILEISVGAFQGLAKLKTLNLEHNKLENFDEKVFKPLINLETLDLGFNMIEHLDKNLLKHNPKLTYLALIFNKISSLDPEFFSNLKNLETLWLAYNRITTLSRDTFEENRKLKRIYLSKNKISEIERDTFKHLNELSRLDLLENECVDQVFGEYSGPKLNMNEEVNKNFTTCYRNYENLVREVRKLINTKTTTTTQGPPATCPTCDCPIITCPVSTFHTTELTTTSECICEDTSVFPDDKEDDTREKFFAIIFGSISFLLFTISILVNIIMCIRKPTNNNYAIRAQERSLEMTQTKQDKHDYTPMNAHSLNSDEPNSGKAYEFGYCADGSVNVYETFPKKYCEVD